MRNYALILFCLISGLCNAQKFPYQVSQITKNSTSDEFRCVFFDQVGLMWLGTNSGLQVYDGYSIKTFKSDAFSPGILPNNQIRCITEDHHDCLWIGTSNGLMKLDKRTGKFYTFHLPTDNQRIIYTIYCSKDGKIWIGTDGGLSYYIPQANKFYTYDHSNTFRVKSGQKIQRITNYSVKSITEDEHGNIFFGTWNNGLIRFRPGSHLFYQYPELNTRNSAYSLHFDKWHRLWVGTWGFGIIRLDQPENYVNPKIHQYPYQPHNFDTYYKIIDGPQPNILWACSREGVSTLNLNDPHAQWTHYASTNDSPLDFSNDICKDNQGNIWIGTFNHGLFQVNTHPSLFKFWTLDTSHFPLSINSITSIYTSDGTWFWLGMNPYGLALYNRKTGKSLFRNSIPGFGALSQEVLGAEVSSIVRRDNGEIWFANNSYGILIKKTDGQVKQLTIDNTPYITDNFVSALFESVGKIMWIGTRSDISIVYPNNKGIRLLPHEGNSQFSKCDVRNITQDSQGNIWLATDNEGIIRISGNPYTPNRLRYHQYSPDHHNYAVDDATACYQDKKKRLWAISNSGGLFKYNRDKDRFEPMNRIYHINGDRIFSINEDRSGNLWLTTDDALIRLSFRHGEDIPDIMSFSDEDGLHDALFSPNASFQYKNEMFICGRKGFFSFPTQEAFPNHRKSKLIITDIIADNESYAQLDSSLRKKISKITPTYTREISIPASIRKIGVEFALLSYSDLRHNKYAYQLTGYDKDWQYCRNGAHQATYQNLPSGTYHLKIKAADHYGQWQNLPYDIEIQILPHWYATGWAFSIYVLLFILAVYGVISWYKGYLKIKNRLQMSVIFTNITHELLTPLTVISATVEDLQNRAPEYKNHYNSILNNIFRLTYLLRQILEVRKSQSGQLKLLVSEGDLTSTVKNICENIQPMTLKNHTQLILHIPEEKTPAWFDPDKLDKILYNLISNAIKYNREGGEVDVSLETDGGHAKLQVSDNGIGLSKDKLRHLYSRFLDGDYRKMATQGTGIGLSLTHDLVLLHHGRIDCKSVEGEGTTFTIILPIRKQDYSKQEIDHEPALEEVKPLSENAGSDFPTVTPDSEDEENGPEDGYKILLVEDNTELLAIMKAFLSKEYQIFTAKNGLQGWNTVQKKELDLVVSDVMMPVMDGIEMTRKIKGDKDFAQLPVILLTAKTTEEDQNIGFNSGADEYLTKPFRMRDLQIRINNIILNRQRIRERFESQTDLRPKEQHNSNPETIFMEKAIACVKKHLSDTDYGRDEFASDMMVSPSTLYNKLRAMTGQSIIGFITNIRLKEAYQMLKENPYIPIQELSIKVGFNTPQYFSKCFKRVFHILPKDFITQNKEK
ncbi:response regulator [Prevotella cerevisiae]|uniref:histidine kinase n=1 Tax=Segatella cerevisiae TaxID=2053716 RepID=A0ABT1BWZ7_9BACT|nr:two-component regulator propeller domain-containing protein [Segatella cerevisiae]MCO6025599.1 response regulator [Segatella cerevisiae]